MLAAYHESVQMRRIIVMGKTRLEILGEEIMAEIQENKKWNQRAVTNEALDHKMDVLMEYIQDIPLIKQAVARLEKDMEIVKAVQADHTERLRRLEDRMDKLEDRMDRLESRL